MTLSPVARAREDWSNGLSSDSNPYPKASEEHQDYAWEFHRLLHQEFVRDCLEPTSFKPDQGSFHEKLDSLPCADGDQRTFASR